MDKLEGKINDRPDVLIIGGGIVGCTVLRECAANGLEAALVEREDFCSQISSGSTEMAHGGFRYLMTVTDWPLVFESLTERELLSRNAPHLARPLNFYMPLYAGDGAAFDPSLPPLPKIHFKAVSYRGAGMMMFQAGMIMYKAFAAAGLGLKGFRPDLDEIGYKKFTRDRMLDLEPELSADGLVGGFKFMDRKVEDVERLAIENVIAGTAGGGCSASNYTEAARFEAAPDGAVKSVAVRDLVGREEITVRPRFVVNATGIGIDDMIERITGRESDLIRKVSGVHIIAPRFFGCSDAGRAYAFWIAGKILFAISKGSDRALIGTTERDIPRRGAADPNRTFAGDVDEIVSKTRSRFPRFEFDIEKHVYYTRVRPLTRESKKADPKAVSRRDFISRTAPNVISVTGKLGPSRSLAENIVRRIFAELRPDGRYNKTHAMPLPGGFSGSLPEYTGKSVSSRPDIPPAAVEKLISRYGHRWESVAARAAEPADFQPLCGAPDALPRCAYLFSWENEMCRTLADLMRRTGDMKFIGDGLDSASNAARYLASKLGWDEQKAKSLLDDYSALIAARRAIVKPE